MDALIYRWNSYCDEHGYHDDKVYEMLGEEEFILDNYGPSESLPADVVLHCSRQLKRYNGERYYYLSNGNAIFFNNLGDENPIDFTLLEGYDD